jgi:hypothetical protein
MRAIACLISRIVILDPVVVYREVTEDVRINSTLTSLLEVLLSEDRKTSQLSR